MGFSGAGCVLALKAGVFTPEPFPGTEAGINAAIARVGSAGSVFVGGGNYTIAAPINVPSIRFIASGYPATTITASASFSGAAMIQNADQTGGQQSCQIEGFFLDGNKASATVPAGILLKNIGQPTVVRDCVVYRPSGNGIMVDAGTGGSASVSFDNCWVNACNDDNILVKGLSIQISFNKITSEFQAAGKAAIHIKGSAGSADRYGARIRDFHYECQNANCQGLLIEDEHDVILEGMTYTGTVTTGDMVKITGSASDSFAITLLNLYRNGGSLNLINDVTNSYTLSAASRLLYTTDALTPMTIDILKGLTLWNTGSYGLALGDGTIQPIASSGALTVQSKGGQDLNLNNNGSGNINTQSPLLSTKSIKFLGDIANHFISAKCTVGAAAPGAGFGSFRWVVGTNAGTLKLVAYSGTSTTPVTIVDNVGAGN